MVSIGAVTSGVMCFIIEVVSGGGIGDGRLIV